MRVKLSVVSILAVVTLTGGFHWLAGAAASPRLDAIAPTADHGVLGTPHNGGYPRPAVAGPLLTINDAENVSSRPVEGPILADTATGDDPLLTGEMAVLREKIRSVLGHYLRRAPNTRDHSPWEIMHWIVAYGVDTQVRAGGPTGDPITAIGWLCFNRPARGQRLFYLSADMPAVQRGPGLQGHDGQLLAMLAQSRVKIDYPVQVSGKSFTVEDIVRYEQSTCYSGTELTFKLIGLMHYLDSDTEWTNQQGQRWNIQRLIREELAQPIRGATCGGSHRLMGLSYAVEKRAKRGEPMIGEFQRARIYIEDYHKYTFKLQNADGSFSTEWFRGRGSRNDTERRLQTTGHVLEWLVFSLPEEQLDDPRTLRAVHYLADLLDPARNQQWKVGPLGHALHALTLYDMRRFGAQPGTYHQPKLADQSSQEEKKPAAG